MSDFLKFLSGNSTSAVVLVIAIVIFLGVVAVIYSIAFKQGRSVSFWPPSIGERPPSSKSEAVEAPPKNQLPAINSGSSDPGNPIVDRGTVLVASSGKQYRISSPYYGGANATIFKAEDQSARAVIAKLYWRGLMPNSPPWEMFRQEQRAAEMLHHRNIARTLDRGLRTGYPFTIMEYFGGGTLRDWLSTHDNIPGRDIASIASQLAEAIDYAHSRGVIHRDIKPGNVLFESDPNGRIALSDFGIAAILGAAEVDITAVGNDFSGSPAYLAPEVLRGGPPRTTADIYSFGIVIYEMLTGVVPFFKYRDPLAIIQAKIESDVPDIREFRPAVPPAVAALIAATLARDPEARPGTARAAIGGVSDWLLGPNH